ncbi:hypothetical protein [Levilactobacillus enshiensis]|uniref:hypothetical protein n=1 Tax=Levilactobacillus enshiensis TaxID=2590213 RepID=UPI001179B24F|nr:hypothetical protein [Levilactobacillus enshiensis]
MNEQQNQKVDQKDLIMNQISINAGNEVASLLKQNAQLTVLAAQLQQENKNLKDENSTLKSKPADKVVSPDEEKEA